MSLVNRLKKGINAYVKNDAKAAAIASAITNKDCSAGDLLSAGDFELAALGLLPLINRDFDASPAVNEALSTVFDEWTSGTILYLLCGPSAVGKDTLASQVKHSLYLERKCFGYLNKYTTRQRRGYEGLGSFGSREEPSGNYEYFESKSEMSSSKDDMALGYSLYGHHYAFSAKHLASQEPVDKYLMSIYGKFENILTIKRDVLVKHRRIPYSILISAPPVDLEGRTTRRHSLSEAEQGVRLKEMKRQSGFIENNRDLIDFGFDLVIENGNVKSVHSNAVALAGFIRKTMV